MTPPLKFGYVYRNNDDAGTILHKVVTLDEIQTDEFVYELEILARRLFTGCQDMIEADIFDGDILEYVSPFEDLPPRDIYLVEWRNHGFRATWIKDGIRQYQGMDGLIDCDEDMRIGGNGYEHPECWRPGHERSGDLRKGGPQGYRCRMGVRGADDW